MSENRVIVEKFTGLILLTGVDNPGIALALFSALADFSVEILDVEQIIISDRLVLTALIVLNSAHQEAIEADLNTLASTSQSDIAVVFGKRNIENALTDLVSIRVSKDKLHPRDLKVITDLIFKANLNIEAITRVSTSPTTLDFRISGGSVDLIKTALESLTGEDLPTFVVKLL